MKYCLLFILTFFISHSSLGQIPKNHFIDADQSTEKGYKLKPFKYKKDGERIYHFSLLNILPFKTDCSKELKKEARILCIERSLKDLILEKNTFSNKDYKGYTLIYFTVDKEGKAYDISCSSFPNNKKIEKQVITTIKKVALNPAKFKKKIVNTRCFTRLDF